MIVTAAQQRRFVSIFWCDAAQSEIIQCDNVGLGAALAPHQEETRTSRGRRRMCQSAARVALHYLSAFVLAPCGGGLQVADCGCLATVSRDMKLVHTQVVASLVATDAPFTLLFFSFFFFARVTVGTSSGSVNSRGHSSNPTLGKQGKKCRPGGLATWLCHYKVTYECSIFVERYSTRQLDKTF